MLNRVFLAPVVAAIHALIEQRKARRWVNGNSCSSRVLDCQLVLKLLDLGRDRASRSSVYECSQLYLQMGQNLGYGVANNRGIEWALAHGADFVLIVNNDAVVLPGAVGRLVDAANSEEDVAIVAPFIGYHDDPETGWYAGGDFSLLRGLGVHRATHPAEDPTKPEEVSFASGCVCLISARAIRDVGAFAEDFFAYVEDAEFCVRLRRAGYRILFEARAKALHHTPRLEDDPAPYKIRLRDRNRRRVIRRHFGPLVRIPFLARFFVTRAILLIRYTVRLDWPRAAAVVKGMVEP